jgi:hypothetical protein
LGDAVLMSYARLSKRPLLFKSFTGLEITEFDTISREIESKYDEHEGVRLSRRKRKRGIGAGRPFKLKEVRERKNLDAFSLLQTVHYIHAFRISIRS